MLRQLLGKWHNRSSWLKKLKEAGVSHELHIYSREGHRRWNGNALVSSFDRIENFLKTNTQ